MPPAGQCQVWLDFDGTLSRQDVLDELIARHAVDDSWKEVEGRWREGRIGSRECLGRQFSLLRVDSAALDRLLDDMALDPGAGDLVALLDAAQVPVTILSDSVDWFIRRILGRHGLAHVPVRSNTAVFLGDRLHLQCPHASPCCASGAAHCKCDSMSALGHAHRRSVYVGDGRSDLCASRKADFRFAKGALAECLEKESLPYVPFSTLADVARCLGAAWQGRPVLGRLARRVS